MDDDRYKKLIESLNLTYQPIFKSLQSLMTKDYLKISEIVNSYSALIMTPIQEEFNRELFSTKPISDMLNSYSLINKQLLDSIFNTPGYQALLESLKHIQLQQVDWSEGLNNEFNFDDYTPEIVEQLSQNIEPEQIAHDLEAKTPISFDVWLTRIANIIAIILGILTFIGVINNNSQTTINETNVHNQVSIEQTVNINIDNIDKDELAKYIVQYMNQITDHENNLTNND